MNALLVLLSLGLGSLFGDTPLMAQHADKLAEPKIPLQVRAERPFALLTPERIAALPETQRLAWEKYMEISAHHASNERGTLAGECQSLGIDVSMVAPSAKGAFKFDVRTPQAWFSSAEGRRIVEAVLSYQTPTGGWSKGVDFRSGPRSPGTRWTSSSRSPWHYCGTLDNRATTEQIELLASAYQATENEAAKTGALRGIEWLLAAQYPNGGWPQVYPIEPGYHEAITFNDGAMLHALEVLLAVGNSDPPYTFVGEALRRRAKAAFSRAISCIIQTQVRVDGKATIWCAQHDPLTLTPTAARLKEPPSLSGAESADLLRFLMRRGPVSPEMIQVIRSALSWFSDHKVSNSLESLRIEGQIKHIVVPSSDGAYWARFYDIPSGKPIFPGAQDGIIYDSYSEMAQHNEVAYDYFTAKPAELLEKELTLWYQRLENTTQ